MIPYVRSKKTCAHTYMGTKICAHTHTHTHTGQFLEENEDVLRSLPPPQIAVEYYRGASMALFGMAVVCCCLMCCAHHLHIVPLRPLYVQHTDAFQTSQTGSNKRRPMCHTLYDVFVNVRDDELEHVYTMQSLSAGRDPRGV